MFSLLDLERSTVAALAQRLLVEIRLQLRPSTGEVGVKSVSLRDLPVTKKAPSGDRNHAEI